MRPMLRLAISIKRADDHEKRNCCAPDDEQPTPARRCILLIKRAESISCRHYANPRNQRIKHEGDWTRELRSDGEYAGLVKQHPQFRSPTWHRTLWPLPRHHWKSVEIV